MKVSKSNFNGVTVHAEGDTLKDTFHQLAALEEVFSEQFCGKCKSNNLRFIVRVVDDNEYHELMCKDCRAKLAFGAHKKGGGLFPKRTEEDEITKKKVYLPDNGWQKWNPEKKINE